ncbi:MAG: lysylphosphatidylglycerol synthase transmembrane domain-containing protein [Bacteroidota bacterium]|nr:lysylphosphatidylglycerol synthase transmembrane domain-containing protein [Bacteroidota bacterium]
MIKNYFKILLPISVGVFCIYFSFRNINFSDFTQYFFEINYSWVAIGIILGALSHISRSYRWKYLINPLGYKLGFINSVLAVFSAYLINYTIPRAGDLARATMISKYEKIPLEKTLGTIVAERAVDVICIIIIISIGLIIEFQRISEKLISLTQDTEISVILVYFGAFVILLFILNKILKKSKYYKSIANFFSGIIEGLTVIFKMKKRNSFIFHSIFIWLMYILMFWATSKAFVELHEVTFFQLMISFTLAALSIMFSNGGIGIYPLAVEESLGWYGIQSTTGLAFGWVSWLSQTMMVVIFGGLSLFVLPFINRNYK